MTGMDALMDALLAFIVVAVCAIVGIKWTDGRRSRWTIKINNKTYDMGDAISDAVALDSPYKGKHLTSVFLCDAAMFPTLDCPCVQHLAGEVNKVIGDWSEADKARFILKLVQTTDYVKDSARFGPEWEEVWCFPVTTMQQAKGDCEDLSFIASALMKLAGLDVVTISLPGHMAVAVHIDGFVGTGKAYELDGKQYWHCETIDSSDVGCWKGDLGEPDSWYAPVEPDRTFKDRIRDGIRG